MPKLIDYPRTSYTGAWELAEIVDDTGGKCAIETAAKKLNRKVSGSFKAIIGSAVKFGLMTSKRDLLTTTTLFRRIKHAYDKAEELQFHREAFLTPPLFTQLCRKFRNRELPVQMLDVMLIREFGVEEINAQNVAKAFVDGCRMCGLLDERNIIADIDALNSTRSPRRELASPAPSIQSFGATPITSATVTSSENREESLGNTVNSTGIGLFSQPPASFIQQEIHPAPAQQASSKVADAVASLFGLAETTDKQTETEERVLSLSSNEVPPVIPEAQIAPKQPLTGAHVTIKPSITAPVVVPGNSYQMQMSGPGVNTVLDIADEDDLAIAIALLEKIRRQFRAAI